MTLDDLAVRPELLDIRPGRAERGPAGDGDQLCAPVKDKERRERIKAIRELCDSMLKTLR